MINVLVLCANAIFTIQPTWSDIWKFIWMTAVISALSVVLGSTDLITLSFMSPNAGVSWELHNYPLPFEEKSRVLGNWKKGLIATDCTDCRFACLTNSTEHNLSKYFCVPFYNCALSYGKAGERLNVPCMISLFSVVCFNSWLVETWLVLVLISD